MTAIINRFGQGGGGGESSAAEKGFSSLGAMWPKYSTTTAVNIPAGYFEADGIIYFLSADVSYAVTSLAVGFDFHYILLDTSVSTVNAPVFTDTTTEPTLDVIRNGWYIGDNRMVGYVSSTAGSAVIDFFNTTALSSNHSRITMNHKVLAENMNPDNDWQEPNVSNTDLLTPINAVEVSIEVLGDSSGTSAISSGWASEEDSIELSSPENAFPPWRHAQRAVDDAVQTANQIGRRWGAIGASRKIKIIGQDLNQNELGALLIGAGCVR